MKTSRQKDLLVFPGIAEEGDYAASAYSSVSILHLVVLVVQYQHILQSVTITILYN